MALYFFWKLKLPERNVLRAFKLAPSPPEFRLEWSRGTFFRPTFFSKKIPMEKSMKMKIWGTFFDQHFFRKIFLWKSQWKWFWGGDFRPTFFSKNFPMEKSKKMKISGTFSSTNIFFEKFSYGKVNEKWKLWFFEKNQHPARIYSNTRVRNRTFF